MKNNSNLVITVVSLVAFLLLWDHFVISRYGSSRPQSVPASSQLHSNDPYEKAQISALAEKIASVPSEKTTPSAYISLAAPQVQATFETSTAQVVSWKIKEGEHWLEMVVREKERVLHPLDLFSSLTYAGQKLSETEAIFIAKRADGLVIKKSISLSSTSPFHPITLLFSNNSAVPSVIQTEFGWGSGVDKHLADTPYIDKDYSAVLAEQRAVAYQGKTQRWRPGFVFGRSVETNLSGTYGWVGVDNNHFLAALISPERKISSIRVAVNKKNPPVALAAVNAALKPGEQQAFNYLLYVGPKNYDELKKLGHHLDQAVDFGFFGFISKTLLFLLNKFESVTDNYGWAIIILTFIIQIVVFPLTIKNFKHSNRMKELQPQLKKVQEQFKSDPKRLQAETFNLYRKNGMKFMGMEGCFPMLLQIPLFFAFYSTLNVAYELRGAPWIFWIRDLAAHDPYYVLPILMGLGMFFQQKMTSVAMDPAQARMMLFMPVMFTFMFLKLPAGLVLYWCVNSLTTIVIQIFMRKPSSAPTTA